MKKYLVFAGIVLIAILAIMNDSAAFQDATKPFTFVARDTIKATKLNANWDTVYSHVNNLYDTLDIKFLRFSDFKDSTIDSIKVNRIQSNPSIDSIQGTNVIRGNPDIDSISGTTKFTGVKTFVNPVTFSDLLTADSIKTSKLINGNLGGAVYGTMVNPGLSQYYDTIDAKTLNVDKPFTTFYNTTGKTLDTVRFLTGSYAGQGLIFLMKGGNDTTFFDLNGEYVVLTHPLASISFFSVGNSHFLVGVANR
jgi:hypothetical protein